MLIASGLSHTGRLWWSADGGREWSLDAGGHHLVGSGLCCTQPAWRLHTCFRIRPLDSTGHQNLAELDSSSCITTTFLLFWHYLFSLFIVISLTHLSCTNYNPSRKKLQ